MTASRPPVIENILDQSIRPLSDSEFTIYQAMVYREAGIFLGEAKKALLTTRLLPRLRQLGLKTFGDYFRLVRNSSEERQRMLDAVCTNETHFFREPAQFELLTDRIIPDWVARAEAGTRPRRARVWSAACSSGEEPYSIAMALLEGLPGWAIEIIATDLSTKVLSKARDGVWPIAKSAEIPETYLRTYMRKGVGRSEGLMRAGSDLRRVIRFSHMNLNDESYPDLGMFDLIFCRNVLIYFDVDSKRGVINRLVNHLHPGGYLFLGHSESLSGNDKGLRGVMPNVYRYDRP